MILTKLTSEQKSLLKMINAPYLDKDHLTEIELDELCDFITDYVLYYEVVNSDVSKFGAELLRLHANIII